MNTIDVDKLILMAIGGIIWFFAARHFIRTNLSKNFSSTAVFTGKLYDCRVLGIHYGNKWRTSDGTIFSVGADKKGIYMCRPFLAPRFGSWKWRSRYYAPLA